jgi:hypothetical protein
MRDALRTPLTLRLSDASDQSALTKLAQRDSAPLPPAPYLVAVREGRIDAALSLSTGELIADPFRRTAELGALLRCHAGPRPVRPRELRAPKAHPRPLLART